MKNNAKRPSKLETTISILLFCVIVLIGVGIYIQQTSYDMSKYGIDAETARKLALKGTEAEVAEGKGEKGLKEFKPENYEMFSPVEIYNEDSLFEKINGKAPLYLEAGFKELKTQRFAKKDEKSLWMELYLFDMGKNQNAFAVYSQQKRKNSVNIDDIENAYRTSNGLYAVHGKFYIEMVGSKESEILHNAMQRTLGNIKSKVEIKEKKEIGEKQLLALDNMIEGSENFYTASAFGYQGFTDIYSASYRFEDTEVIGYLSRRENPEKAKKLMEDYVKFLQDNDAKEKTTDNKILNEIGTKAFDFYGYWMIIFAEGDFIAGVHEAESKENAVKLAEGLAEKIKSLK